MPRRPKLNPQALFEAELTRRGLTFTREDADAYRIKVGKTSAVVSLANVARNVERDGDPAAITSYLDEVIAALRVKIPKWPDASRRVLFSAEPTDHDLSEVIALPVTKEVAKVLTVTDAKHSRITWVTKKMCEKWGVTPEEVGAAAAVNQDKLLDGIALEVDVVRGSALGMVPLASAYKASVIFAPGFKAFVEAALGWPVLVVIPCRDFIYVVANDSPLVGHLGAVVVREFGGSGYPITTEVMRVSDGGIEAIGNFVQK